MPLVTASPGTCPRWTSRDMAMDDRPSRAGVGGAAREPRACPGGWTPAASPPSLNLPTSPLFEQCAAARATLQLLDRRSSASLHSCNFPSLLVPPVPQECLWTW